MCPDLFFFGALAPSGAPKYLTKIQISFFFFINEGNYSRRHLRNHPPFAFSCTDGPPEEERWSPYWAELVGRKGFRRVMEVMSEWQSYWKVSEPQRGEFSPCHQPHCNCGWEKGLSRHISLIYKRPNTSSSIPWMKSFKLIAIIEEKVFCAVWHLSTKAGDCTPPRVLFWYGMCTPLEWMQGI